jgi:hypothetical protein
MSWRETLGVTTSAKTPYAHNSQNAQKPIDTGNCADIAGSAYRGLDQQTSRLLETLSDACKGVDITPAEVKEALAPEDIEDWRNGAISDDTLAAFARSLEKRRKMNLGKRPTHYTEQATCNYCGPIWLWFSGKVLTCPWCWNRLKDMPIPRPSPICCGDCIHFRRVGHPNLGHCGKGEPEAIAGLLDMEQRYCERFLPKPQQTNNDQLRPPRVETKR